MSPGAAGTRGLGFMAASQGWFGDSVWEPALCRLIFFPTAFSQNPLSSVNSRRPAWTSVYRNDEGFIPLPTLAVGP